MARLAFSSAVHVSPAQDCAARLLAGKHQS
jgi:hypothetical protein